ncbi:MAG: NAD(+) diphosphatase [Pseudomonadota bacterium]
MKHAETVTFGGGGLARHAELRGNKDAIEALRATSKTLLIWNGKPLMALGSDGAPRGALHWLDPEDLFLKEHGSQDVFLGLDPEGVGLFASDVSSWDPIEQDTSGLGLFLDSTQQTPPGLEATASFAELRALMTRLTPWDAEVAATAKAVLNWHAAHGFCANCGAKSLSRQAGWSRSCPACSTTHFPRTDPVVIMLITHGNSVLIGRSPWWPEGMYSLLAGFVEPGETMEAAVRREVFEEAGVSVGEVSYLASQPWPFPASLMFGAKGEAISTEITLDPVELEDALWVTREDMAAVFAGQHPTINPARSGAIAHFLLDYWLRDSLE